VVSRRGRFGKYGDFKRKSLLRAQRSLPPKDTKIKTAKGQSPLPKTRYQPLPPQFSVREAHMGDMPFIRSLSLKAFQQYGPYEESIPAWQAYPSTITFMAARGIEPVGFAMIGPSFEKDSGVSELLAISVAEPWRRRSVGTMLLKAAEKRATTLGMKRMVLHTAVENLAAMGLFRKMGYREVKIKKGFYPAGQDAVMMIKELYPPVNP